MLSVVVAWAAVEDSVENRKAQARRYMEAAPPSELFKDMAEQMAQTMPEGSREAFKAMMTKHLDVEKVTEGIEQAMLNHFTAEELSAMADFYGSPAGKSVLKKFGAYMAEMMPVVQTEVAKAHAKAMMEQAEEKPENPELR